MQTIRIILFLSGILLIQSRDIKCQRTKIPYDDWPFKCSFETDSGKFVINSKEDFKHITNCILLNYDFNKYTIIGVQGTVGGCKSPTIDFQITKDDYEKKYIIIATVCSYGVCRKGFLYRRIIYTEKFREDYIIDFIKIE